jgi:hypothetical protein
MMKNRSSAFQRYRKHAILIALASILVLAFILTLSTFGVQAATVDFSSQTSSSQLAPNVISIDGYVFGVVNGGDYPLSGWDVHAQFQDGSGAVYDATTDGNGYYKFDDLPAGVYKVWIDMKTGWVLYPGMNNPVENITVPSNNHSILFKVRQGGTPTPGTPEPATRVDGYVYEEDCDGVHAYPGALLELWSSSLPDTLDSKLQSRNSDVSGYFNFHILPADLADYFHLLLKVPSDMEVINTIAPDAKAHVIAPDHIRFDFPGFESLSGNQFILRKKDLICETPTPTPTATFTPTPTITPTATPFKLYLPIILTRPPMCEVGYIYVNVWGKDYHIPLQDVPYVYTLRPLPWQHPTTFYLREYVGDPPLWTQYHPFYHKQEGGLEFTYPGGHSGEEFSLYVRTECGEVAIMTDVDDPTPTPPPAETPAPTSGWITLAEKDFDNGGLGAVERSGNPTWGVADCKAASSPNSLWPAAWGRAAAEPCAENYPNNAESWLVFGPFNLTNAAQAEVTFDYLLNTEKSHDWFGWYASEDGKSFTGIRESGNSNGWTNRTFDLQNWVGKPQVWFAFFFESDAQITDTGVFLDNVTIRKYVDGGPPRSIQPRVMAPDSDSALKPATAIRH